MDVIVDGYEDKERKLHPPKPNKVFISHAEKDTKIVKLQRLILKEIIYYQSLQKIVLYNNPMQKNQRN